MDLRRVRRPGHGCGRWLGRIGGQIVRDTDLVTTLPEALFQRVSASHGLQKIERAEPLPQLQIAILRMEHLPLTPVAQELLGWVRQAAQH
jgi:hypothetical protein